MNTIRIWRAWLVRTRPVLHQPPNREKRNSMENISSSRDRLITTQTIFIGTGCVSSAILINLSRYAAWPDWKRIQLRRFQFPSNGWKKSYSLFPCSLTNSPAEYLIIGDCDESHCANCDVCHRLSFGYAIIVNIHWGDASKRNQASGNSWQPGSIEPHSIGASEWAAPHTEWQTVTHFR